jgi:hypothetical protein
MALIPKVHTAVTMYPVDPADVALINSGSSSATYGIFSGQVVGITSAGYVKHATASNASPKIIPIGFAGDSLAGTAAYTAYQDSILVSSGGSKKNSQNRVSDYFNETLGSGLLSVYVGGGEFYTDMFVSSESFTVGALVYANAVAAYTTSNAGMFSSTSTNAYTVGIITGGVSQYPSGVPGVDGGSSSDYSMGLSSYNTTGFIKVLMNIHTA